MIRFKYIFPFIIVFVGQMLLSAQTSYNYNITAKYTYGTILKHTRHLQNIVDKPINGGEIAIEWQTWNEEPWHQFLGFPRIGLGAVAFDLGNPEMLGQLYAVYPYLNFNLLKKSPIRLGIKAGAGTSFLTKRFNNTATALNDLNTGNAAIGSIVNVFFAGGANVEVPLGSFLSLGIDLTWNHASNGSFFQPNSGINMLNASAGLKVYPYASRDKEPMRKAYKDISRDFQFEISASGGARELYYRDDKLYPTGSVVIAAFRQMTNFMRLGLAVDGFYDGVYNGNTKFQRTYLTTDEFANKVRVGTSLQPELTFGRFSAGFHFGVYLYNPLKNLEPYNDAKAAIESGSTLNKPIFYKYDIEKEDGWLYTRAAIKYNVSDHFFLSLGLKTHLQKAEFIEWGMGYRL